MQWGGAKFLAALWIYIYQTLLETEVNRGYWELMGVSGTKKFNDEVCVIRLSDSQIVRSEIFCTLLLTIELKRSPEIALENFGGAFFEDADAFTDALFVGEFAEPAGRFVHVFEGEAEGAVVHGDEMFRFDVVKDFHGVIRTHVHVFEVFRAIGADGEEGDFGFEVVADVFKAFEVGAVTGVINFASLVFEDEAAITTMAIPECAGTPVFAGSERDLPISVGKTLPPIELDDAFEAEVVREVAHAPGHDADFGMRQFAETWFVKVIEMRVGEQDEIDGRQVFDFETGAFDAFEEEEPVGEIGVDENVEIGELNKEGGVTDPGEGDFALGEFGKFGFLMLTVARGQKCLQNHFVKKRARVEGIGRGQIFEGLGHFPLFMRRPIGPVRTSNRFRHKFLLLAKISRW
jgi:hypothetical protein